MKRRKRCKQGRHVTTDPQTSWSLRSDRLSLSFGRYVAIDPSRTRSLRSDQTVSDIDQRRVVVDALHAIWARVSQCHSVSRGSVRARSPSAARPSRQQDSDDSDEDTDED
ncbi:hypothetical protein DY000_02031418 [Brassica cretica]|uniref:Uncharacterized protein n=1 Tax=Brassica cretica TaxID=69181 RepID=A0ABQ7DIP7_BRACR|nr:hypothetical protein DY000_02031418 [Brassica cretica]